MVTIYRYLKNRRYKLPFAFICIISVFISSCSDFLEEEPISNVSDETFWNTEDDGNSAIAGCYAQLRKALNNGLAYYAHGDLATDVFSPEREISEKQFDYAQTGEWGVSVSSTETGAVMYRLRDFGKFYSTIRQANLCIANIPKIPEDEYSDYSKTFNQFMGEAYFIRAFSYFYMAHIWGDVPIIDDNMISEVDLTDYEREDEDKVLAKAIDDCETALTYLDWDYSKDENKAVRANKGVVWALLAHIYAWQGNYEACEKATKKITDKGYYSYVDRNDYLEIFEGQSNESIFEIAQNSRSEASNTDLNISGKLLRDDYLTIQEDKTLWPFDTLTVRQTLFYDQNDLRRKNGFWEFSDEYPVLLKYSNITYTSSTYALGLNNIIVYRLAGIALLQAEAQAALGKYGEARITLNKIRALSGLDESSATNDKLFEAVIEERGRELFMEGHRFYDLVRLARKKGVYKFGSSDSDKITEKEFKQGKSYWPVQPSIIETNPLLTQTTYWQSEME
jgi:hypothetical protein